MATISISPDVKIFLGIIGVVIGIPAIIYSIVENNNTYKREGPHNVRTFTIEEDEPSGGKRKNKSRKLRR